jgi:MraZ protein
MLIYRGFTPIFGKIGCQNNGSIDNLWENVGKDMTFFFSGSTTAKLDEKGRFVLPKEMRYGLVEEGKCEFVIGLSLGGCLAIYRKSVIEKIVAKFRSMQHMAQYQKFFTLFFSTLHPTECDQIGRVSLPQSLKSAIGIQKELVVAGVMDKIELWPKEVYERNLQNVLSGKDADLAKMTEEAFALLSNESVDKPAQTAPVNPLYFTKHEAAHSRT